MNHARRFINDLHAFNRCFPNIQVLDVRPGTVLSRTGGTFRIEGRLDQFVTEDEALRARIVAAIDRLEPREGNPAGTSQSLKLVSSGTTLVGSNAGGGITIPQADFKVQIVVKFESAGEFLFDTTEPATWFTFSDTEMKDLNQAALRYLKSGRFVVTSSAWSKLWLYRISQQDKSSVAFTTSADVADVNVGKLADIFVTAGLTTSFDSSASLSAEVRNSVACFSCVKRSSFFFSPVLESVGSMSFLDDSGSAAPLAKLAKEVPVVGMATPDDLDGEE